MPGLRAPMVGRDRELDVLEPSIGAPPSEGRPHLVTVYGDPGVGKSRLVARVRRGAEQQRTPPRDPARPMPALRRRRHLLAARRDAQGLAGVPTPTADGRPRARSSGAVASLLHARTSATTPRRRRPRSPTPSASRTRRPVRTHGPARGQRRVHPAWRALFSALAPGGPVVVVVEDIHWADPALLDLLEELAERVVGPVLFVCPSRPELTGAARLGRRPAQRRHVSLDPLTADRSRTAWCGCCSRSRTCRRRSHARILERAEGNPFFLEEILRQLIDEGPIVRDGDRWRAAPGIDEVDIPDSVQAVLAARIDLLDPVGQAGAAGRGGGGAGVLARSGRRCWTATGPTRGPLDGSRSASWCCPARLVARRRAEYIFKHILTRDVAYASLPGASAPPRTPSSRRGSSTRPASGAGEFIELLAHHYPEAYLGARDDGLPPQEVENLRRRAFDALLGVTGEAHRRFAIAKATSAIEQALRIAPVRSSGSPPSSGWARSPAATTAATCPGGRSRRWSTSAWCTRPMTGARSRGRA